MGGWERAEFDVVERADVEGEESDDTETNPEEGNILPPLLLEKSAPRASRRSDGWVVELACGSWNDEMLPPSASAAPERWLEVLSKMPRCMKPQEQGVQVGERRQWREGAGEDPLRAQDALQATMVGGIKNSSMRANVR